MSICGSAAMEPGFGRSRELGERPASTGPRPRCSGDRKHEPAGREWARDVRGLAVHTVDEEAGAWNLDWS
ncbi:hypothetical protein ACWDF6_11585, partial [Streptomyces sp. NPDC001155]